MGDVAIVIPVLEQRWAYLRKAVLSALAQDVPCDVLVAVDPRTGDETIAAVARLAEEARRLHLVHAEGAGIAAALNVGFRATTAPRAAILLSDDWLEPDAVRRASALNATIVSTASICHHADGRESLCRRSTEALHGLPSLRERADYLSHLLLFDRRTVLEVGGVDERIGQTGTDDFDLLWTLLEHGATVAALDVPLYHYRDHGGPRLSLRPAGEQAQELRSILEKHGEAPEVAPIVAARHRRHFGRLVAGGRGAAGPKVDWRTERLKARALRRSVRSGVIWNAYALARLLERRPDLEEEPGELRRLLRLAADQDAIAAFHLGRVLLDGIGGRVDLDQATAWLERAAGLGIAAAARALGDLDPGGDAAWHRRAARLGDGWAMRKLARLAADPVEAARWHARAVGAAPVDAARQSRAALQERPRGVLDAALRHAMAERGAAGRKPAAVIAEPRRPHDPYPGEVEALFEALRGAPFDAGQPIAATLETAPRGRYVIDASLLPSLLEKGWRVRDLFAHRFVVLPVAAPGAMAVKLQMLPKGPAGRLAVLVLHAENEAADLLGDEVWFNDALQWHRLHLGRRGHVAFAILHLEEKRIRVLNLVSDLVQRQSRRPVERTRIERAFGGWPRLLMHAVLSYARLRGYAQVLSPRASTALLATDKRRRARSPLFRRVYDLQSVQPFRAKPGDRWWVLDVAANLERTVLPETRPCASTGEGPVIGLLHDLERGDGHRDIDKGLADGMDQEAPSWFGRATEIEQRLAVASTVAVVGRHFEAGLDGGRRALAFHGFEHWADVDVDDRDAVSADLARCRALSFRVAGFHVPRSDIGLGLRDEDLVAEDYRWLAASSSALELEAPVLRGGIVSIPVHLDDFNLHRGRIDCAAWRALAEREIESRALTCIGLHDCYAGHWLPGHEAWLRHLRERVRFVTFDEIAWQAALAEAL